MKGTAGFGRGAGTASCNSGSCQATWSGSFGASQMGNGEFSATFNYDQSAAMSNGGGGSCYPASGTMTFTTANQNTVTTAASGLLCEVGSGQAPLTLNGSYVIDTSNSTGRFSRSVGVGTVQLGIDGSGNGYMNLGGAMGNLGAGSGAGGGGGGSGGGGGMPPM